MIARNRSLQDAVHCSAADIRSQEAKALVQSSTIARKRGAIQDSLAAATYLSDLVPQCREVGLNIEGPAQIEVASVLWDQGEMATSIHMLRDIVANVNLGDNTAASYDRSTALAMLAHHVAEARLEKPQEIIDNYLEPAITELQGRRQGPEAGDVYHEFASFCDKQLKNTDGLEDYTRMN